MARIRYLKPEFFTDEDLAELPLEARVLYAGLWCYADRDGRLEDRPKYLKAMIFPYDRVEIEKNLCLLSKPKNSGRPFIQRYSIEEKNFIQILSWEKHQSPHHTERDSIIPPAPPLTTKDKEKDKEKYASPELELNNREIPVKEPLSLKPFELFWNYYPKKKNKGDAEKAWLKIKPSIELQQKITQKLDLLKKSEDWMKDGGKWIPYPASWLNAKGWEDQVKAETDWIQESENAHD